MTRQWIEVIHTPRNQAGHLVKFANVSAASRCTDRNKVLVREKVTNVHIMR